MNNKGQTLVLFVLILPILVLAMAVLVEVGDLLVYQKKLEHNAKSVAEYGIDNIEDLNIKFKLEQLNQENFGGKAKIKVTNEYVSVTVKEEKNKVFVFLNLPATIDFTYKAQIKDGKKQIKKE